MPLTSWHYGTKAVNFTGDVFSNSVRALVEDGKFATAAFPADSTASFRGTLKYNRGYAAGNILPSATLKSTSYSYSADIATPYAFDLDFIQDLQMEATIKPPGDSYLLRGCRISGFDFSDEITPDTTLISLEMNIIYKIVDGVFSIDTFRARANYVLPPNRLLADPVRSSNILASPDVAPGPTTLSMPSILSHATVPGPRALMALTDPASIVGTAVVSEPELVQLDPPPLPPADWSAVGKLDVKTFLYKVSKPDGTYVGVWATVADELEFTERINSPGTTTTVKLARSADSTAEARAGLVTQASDQIVTEDGHRLIAVYETPNTVGEDTDVDLNYNVDVYVCYGEFHKIVTQLSEPITTESEDNLIVVSGAPLGTRVFSGFVLDYEAVYGDEQAVWVTLSSHGFELSNEVVRTGENTNVTFNGQDTGAIFRGVLNSNPGRMSYEPTTIIDTGVTDQVVAQLNTKLEVMESAFDLAPDGWWWRGDVAENNVYLQPLSSGYDHTFIVGWHIKELRLKRSLENLVNTVYFVGGQTDPNNVNTTMYRKYTNPASYAAWRKGLERITDRRYLVGASMARRANKVLSRRHAPIFSATVKVTSGRYDLESIRVGQTVGFKNNGNYIDSVPPMQIVSRQYTPSMVTLELGVVLDRVADTMTSMEKRLSNETYQGIPGMPG
ncbi:hypothetical protein [Tsukamurella spumae]|uniref:Uncharacterized protein n=1 Tax=Tsukamurella spumae TaxID=44753 RepID=A0A846X0S6_9ACTN|nr:hypothetical protein [Tsukamurella spumae]NKY18854.1 hypothetical protein [Tsukamurella spumae]